MIEEIKRNCRIMRDLNNYIERDIQYDIICEKLDKLERDFEVREEKLRDEFETKSDTTKKL